MWINRQEYERLKNAERRLFHSEYREKCLNNLIWETRAKKDDNKVEEKEMTYSKWAIFYKDGLIRTINAYYFNWDDDNETLSFTDEDDDMIACFKLNNIDGVAMVQDSANVGVEAPMGQLPAPETKEIEIPAKPVIINDPNKDYIWHPSPWTPSDPWWQQPQVTWSSADTKPLAERGTE